MPQVKLPALPAGVSAATVQAWLVQPGEPVAEGAPLLRLDTDEALILLQSPISGALSGILAPVGRTVTPGAALADISLVATSPNRPSPKPEEPPATMNQPAPQATDTVPLMMPQAGNSMEEGTVLGWRVKEGDSIKAGDILLEIETDKSTMEVEAPFDATVVSLVAAEGTVVPVKQPIAILRPAPGVSVQTQPATAAPPAAATPAPAPAPSAPAAQHSSADLLAVPMPQAGNSMEEGTILQWRVKPGDRVKAGDILVEIETDKSTMEVESPAEGIIAELLANSGDVIPVKQPIATIHTGTGPVPAAPVRPSTFDVRPSSPDPRTSNIKLPTSTSPSSLIPPPSSLRPKASPVARRIARERGLDLSRVPSGSGPGGRILSTDLEEIPASAAQKAAPAPAGPGGRRRMSNMRRAIAKNLVMSKQTVPHFYVRLTVDADPLFALYKAEKAKYQCSVNDVLMLACARVLMEFPALRSRIDGDDIVETPAANIGVAVGIDDGLLVPVVVGADRMNLAQVAADTRRIAELARQGRIEGQGKGVFTISNLGMFGVEEFTAIINPPEAAILAAGAVRESVIVKNGAMRPGRVMTMNLSCDHRVVDGMMAAKFMARLKEVLEQPEQLLSR